jgi:hypothetical protein
MDSCWSIFDCLDSIVFALAKYSPTTPFIYKKVEELSADLRAWYFEIGGLSLSETDLTSPLV